MNRIAANRIAANRIVVVGIGAVSSALLATGSIANLAGRRLRQPALEAADEQALKVMRASPHHEIVRPLTPHQQTMAAAARARAAAGQATSQTS